METTTEKPFWAEDGWKKKGLPLDLESQDLSGVLKEAVPEHHRVEKGKVIADYLFKDGLLIYHFYKADRKEIYDQAHEAMADLRGKKDEATQQAVIATEANAALSEKPWWKEFEQILHTVFSESFKYSDRKVDYYREVDSWSVMMPEPKGPVRMTAAHLEVPVAKVALSVGAK